MRLLQVCNVGNIVGGTAACAWTVARSLPGIEHTIAFLSPISSETRAPFRFSNLVRLERLTPHDLRRLAPDVVLLHNTPRGRVESPLPVPTIQYLHSRIPPAPADVTVYCSAWLARQSGQPNGRILYQAVPIPPQPGCWDAARPLRTRPIVGRLCTPQARKWPLELVDFHRRLAEAAPEIDWEFVGAPPSQQALYRRACGDRATFHNAGWNARAHLWRWNALLYHHPTLSESFGRTCAEAMRAGCLPIVDNRGGFREQIERSALPETVVDGIHQNRGRATDHPPTPVGWLCDTPDDFASALAQLGDPRRRWAMSRAARALADERFSLERFARDLTPLVHAARATHRHASAHLTRDASS